MNEPNVICVIVTFNREALLLKTLDSVLSQTLSPSKIIIVDNNSSDNTHSAICKLQLKHPKIEYCNTGENLGGAGGFHKGFQIAAEYTYDYLWLMDDDLQPEPSCLENLVGCAKEHGIFQPVRFNLDGSCAELSPVIYDLNNPFYINPKRRSVSDIYESGKNSLPFDIHGVPFEGPLISQSVIEAIGLPNPKFFIFYDDLDYSIRARLAGFKIKCIPAAKAIRLLQNNQSNDLKSWKGYFMLRNLFYIHHVYGENFFVRFKPYSLALGYLLLSLFKFDIKQARVVLSALADFRGLQKSEQHKP